MLTKGAVFIHDTFLDPGWIPGPGQTYADSPKATMKVFVATSGTVWYGYSDAARSGWRLSRKDFEKRFPNSLA